MKAPASYWDKRSEVCRSFLGKSTYTSMDASYYRYRQWKIKRQILNWIPPNRIGDGCIIDYGCGTGNMTVWLGNQYRRAVLGVDISEWMIQQAQNHHLDKKQIRFFQIENHLDVAKYILEPASLIIIVLVLQHNTDEDVIDILSTLAEHLTDDGYIFIVERSGSTHSAGSTWVVRTQDEWHELFAQSGLLVKAEAQLVSRLYNRFNGKVKRLVKFISSKLQLESRKSLTLNDYLHIPLTCATALTDYILPYRNPGYGIAMYLLKKGVERNE